MGGLEGSKGACPTGDVEAEEQKTVHKNRKEQLHISDASDRISIMRYPTGAYALRRYKGGQLLQVLVKGAPDASVRALAEQAKTMLEGGAELSQVKATVKEQAAELRAET